MSILSGPGEEPVARTWTAVTYEIDAASPVPAGVDGEAVVFDPPLQFTVRAKVLRCRIARRHPGASLSTAAPAGAWAALRKLVTIATGRDR